MATLVLKALVIHLEEIRRLLRMASRNVVKGSRGDIIGLALADKGIVFQQILDFGLVAVGLGA
jgi:hypothetical protein